MADGVDEVLLLDRIAEGPEPVLEVQVVPADDGVLDEAVATLGDLLVVLFALLELARGACGDVSGEAVGQLDAAELLLDRLPQGDLVDVARATNSVLMICPNALRAR